MLEKISYIRDVYGLDKPEWENLEYVEKVYENTAGTYPMLNLGRLVVYGGVVSIFFATTQVFSNPICVVQQIAGLMAISSGLSISLFSEGQFDNYIRNKESRKRLKKYGIKKPFYEKLKNQEKEF